MHHLNIHVARDARSEYELEFNVMILSVFASHSLRFIFRTDARKQQQASERAGQGKARRKGHTFYTRGSCFVVFASLLTHIIVFCTTVLSIDIVARLLNAHSLLSVSFSLCAYVCKMFILHRVQSVAWVAKAILFLLLRFYLRFQLAVFIHCSHTQFFLSNFFLLALIFMCMCEIL